MQSLAERIKQNFSQIVLAIVVLALIISSLFLIIENRKLKENLEQSKKFVTDVGYRFSDLNVKTLEEKEETLSLSQDGKQTLLFVFRTSCEYCLQQYPYWRSLISSVDRNKWNVVAVTSEEDPVLISQHLKENGMEGTETRIISAEDMVSARLAYTPMTLTLNSDGIVTRVWPGLKTNGFDLE